MTDLYFAGLVPPATLSDEITAMKEQISRRFGSAHALKSPPHITLIAPFRATANEIDMLISALEEVVATVKPFRVSLSGFGSFGKRVVYVHVPDHAAIECLHKSLVKASRQVVPGMTGQESPFHPHITLATRDLTPAACDGIISFVNTKKFTGEFTADSVVLFRYNGKQWDTVAELFFER